MVTVLQSAFRYPPAIGGVESYVHDIVDAGQRSGCFGSFVITSSLSVRRLGHVVDASGDPAHVRRLEARPRLGSMRYPKLVDHRRELHDGSRRVDVVHAHSIYFPSFDLPLLRGTGGTPLVCSAHYFRRRRLLYRPYLRLVRQSLERASCLVVLSKFEREMLETDGVLPPQCPTVAISPVVRPNPFLDPARAVGSEVRACFIGRMDEGKGVLDLVEVVRGCRRRGVEMRLTVAGPDGGVGPALVEAATEELTSGAIDVRGPVSEEEKLRILAASDFLLLPSRYEAFGIVLAEAMAAGAVPVAYAVGSVPEVLGDGRFGLLVDRVDPDAMAEAVVTALGDAHVMRSFRVDLPEHADDCYGPRRWDAAWCDLYTKVAAGELPG